MGEAEENKKTTPFSIKYLFIISIMILLPLVYAYGREIRFSRSDSFDIVIAMLTSGLIVIGFIISIYPDKILRQDKKIKVAVKNIASDIDRQIVQEFGNPKQRDNENIKGTKKLSNTQFKKNVIKLLLMSVMILLIPIWLISVILYLAFSRNIYDYSISLHQFYISFLIYIFVVLSGYYFFVIVEYILTALMVYFLEYIPKGLQQFLPIIRQLSEAIQENQDDEMSWEE